MNLIVTYQNIFMGSMVNRVIMNSSWLEVNFLTLKSNVDYIKSVTSKKIIGVVKANAYGHGIVEISKALISYGIDCLAVASISEAILLRNSGINSKILLLGGFDNEDIEYIEYYSVTPSIVDLHSAKLLEKYLSKNINAQLKIDTGMSRMGFKAFNNEINDVFKLKKISIEGIYTHLAASDSSIDYSNMQYKTFTDFLSVLPQRKFDFVHISNTSAALNLNYTETHCRIGIGLYGYDDSTDNPKGLKPIAKWKTKIRSVKNIYKGEHVGYSCNFTAREDMKIAILPIGYHDGFSRSNSNISEILIGNKKAKVVGNVCMDQIMIDITNINVSIGDEVTILGDTKDFNARTHASNIQTISYEILSRISPRVSRKYIGSI